MKWSNKYSIFFTLFAFEGFKYLDGDPLGLLYFGFLYHLQVLLVQKWFLFSFVFWGQGFSV